MSDTPQSNTVTPPSSSIRYTFIVFGMPPRTSHTPSAIRSGSDPWIHERARVRALASLVRLVSAREPAGGSTPSWRATSPLSR